MKTVRLKLAYLLFFLLVFQAVGYTQQTYTANVEKSKVIVEGTSNIHDWEMIVEELESTLQLKGDSEKDIVYINFVVPVKSMKSGKSKMDKNTYEALNAEKFESITFKSTSVENTNSNYLVIGNLTISGVTKTVKIPFELMKENDIVKLNLKYDIHMLDYKVEPPTALFGTIKTGERVTINVNLIYNN